MDARWLDALEPAQRAELLAGLPPPGDGEAAPFAWAHRALCRQGLRLRIAATPGRAAAPVVLELRHQPRQRAEAPLLVIDVDAGAHCVLLETHERSASDCAHPVTQNLHSHIQLGAGARLQHLRVVAPARAGPDRPPPARHAGARRPLRAGAGGHRQRLPPAARHACNCAAAARAPSTPPCCCWKASSSTTRCAATWQAAHSASAVESLVLAQGGARAVSNAYTRIAAGADEADVRQRLSGIPLGGQPRLTLRPHLEILHDNVQAAHGATWGALPADALFYARQRGLDEASARALITEGMARAVLERGLDDSELLAQWLASGWLGRRMARQLQGPTGLTP
ncbi:MAG: SufD family Fe-S cluster assembly protein [Ottowia sp.]